MSIITLINFCENKPKDYILKNYKINYFIKYYIYITINLI